MTRGNMFRSLNLNKASTRDVFDLSVSKGNFTMLVLTRKQSESIKIGTDIQITVTQIGHGKVKLGITAPANVRILRTELKAVPGDSSPIAESVPALTPVLVAEAAHGELDEESTTPEFDDLQMEFSTDYAAELEDQMLFAMAAS